MKAPSSYYVTRSKKGLRRNVVVQCSLYLTRARGGRLQFRYVVISRHFTMKGAHRALERAKAAA